MPHHQAGSLCPQREHRFWIALGVFAQVQKCCALINFPCAHYARTASPEGLNDGISCLSGRDESVPRSVSAEGSCWGDTFASAEESSNGHRRYLKLLHFQAEFVRQRGWLFTARNPSNLPLILDTNTFMATSLAEISFLPS